MSYADMNSPELVFWKKELAENDGDEWQELIAHDCNGFSIDTFPGFVIELKYQKEVVGLLEDITCEVFCKDLPQSLFKRSNADSLDWGTEQPHREAYAAFLKAHGLESGRLELLVQAVYPLAPTRDNLNKLGVQEREIPAGAELLILGCNCD